MTRTTMKYIYIYIYIYMHLILNENGQMELELHLAHFLKKKLKMVFECFKKIEQKFLI
jgi:hypothetical protein